MQRQCAGVELLTRCPPSPFSPESRLSSVFCQHSPLQFKLRGTERRRGQNDGHCVIHLGLLRPRTILLQEGRAWLFSWHFYGCCTLFLFNFWWEEKEYWNVLRLFLCAARVFVVLFCFWKEERYHMLQEVKLDSSPTPQLLNLPLTVVNFGIKVWKSAQCNVYKTGWPRRHLLQSCNADTRIKENSVLVSHCKVQLSHLVFIILKAINR